MAEQPEMQALVAEPALSGEQTLVAEPDPKVAMPLDDSVHFHSASPLHFFHLQCALFSELLLL